MGKNENWDEKRVNITVIDDPGDAICVDKYCGFQKGYRDIRSEMPSPWEICVPLPNETNVERKNKNEQGLVMYVWLCE